MLKKYFLLAVGCLLLIACEKEEAAVAKDDPKTELITGFVIIDPNDDPLQDIGQPNEQRFTNPDKAGRSYPNPTMNIITVKFFSATPTKMSAWLTYAQMDASLKTTTYYMPPAGSPGTIALEVAKDMDVEGSISFNVNIAALPPGPYRMYFKEGQELAWRNVIIKKL